MLLSRLWLLLLTLAGGAAVALLVLLPRPLERDMERDASVRLERSQQAASLLLRVTARKWIDTSARAATDAVLKESLEQATRGPADLGLVHKTVQERLRSFAERLKADLVIATDARGQVIARAGLDEGIYKDGVEGLPLVADALRGLRGDDSWSLGDRLYRVAASPVIAHDRYVGSLVIGQEAGSQFAEWLRREVDTDVALLLHGKVVAASTPLPALLDRLPTLYAEHADEITKRGHSAALKVGEGTGHLVVLSFVPGEASGLGAAYALYTPRPQAGDLGTLLGKLATLDTKLLPSRSLGIVGGGALLALLIGIGLLRLAERPMARLERQAQGLARGERDRLDEEDLPSRYEGLARAVNEALERSGGARTLSVPTPASPAWAPPVEPPRRSETLPRVAPAGPMLAHETPTALYPRAVSESLRTDSLRTPVQDPIRKLSSEARAQDTAPDFVDAPRALVQMAAPAKPAPPPPLVREDFDERTTVAKPSDALLKQAGADPEAAALEAEFRAVFQEFVDTKQRCGESTEGVTFDRFVDKLRSNRAQLISRYACKTVRFQVYVKDGRAALKATPS